MTTVETLEVDEEFLVDGQLPDEIVVEGPDGQRETYATRDAWMELLEQRLVADGGQDA